jgi:hypothetical protein
MEDAMALKTERTTFSLDVLGRYTCNTWQEAMASSDQAMRPDARPFDVIVLGGGTFGAAVAQHLFNPRHLPQSSHRETLCQTVPTEPKSLTQQSHRLPAGVTECLREGVS